MMTRMLISLLVALGVSLIWGWASPNLFHLNQAGGIAGGIVIGGVGGLFLGIWIVSKEA